METVLVTESGWTRESIEERCRALRGTLLRDGLPQPELDALAPGGAKNQVTDPLGAAVTWYVLLRTERELAERQKAIEAARAEAAVAAALSGTPVPVELSVGVHAVHPKSYHALRYCDALDAALREVVAQAADIDAAEVHAHALIVESLAVRVWAWILTSAGPELPFDEAAAGTEPPDWTRRLTPDDLVALLEAHVTVNHLRVRRIAQLFPPERERESRLNLAGFLGTFAQEQGQRPYEVLRRWSVAEVFAEAAVTAQQAREARAAAEADRMLRHPVGGVA